MSTDLSRISQYCSKLLDVALFEDVCINGLQVEGTRPISLIAGAVSPSLFVIEEAAKRGAELLLTHHGLFLKNAGVAISGTLSKRVRALFRNDMHLLSYHLPLDAHQEIGNTWPILKQLGCYSLEPFGKYQNRQIGVKGLCSPIPQEKLFERLQQLFRAPGVVFGRKKESIQSLAFVSGGGHRLLSEALDQKIDCFITGTVDESIWSQAMEGGISVMAFGHYATEKAGVQLLGEHLTKEFHIPYIFIEEANPF